MHHFPPLLSFFPKQFEPPKHRFKDRQNENEPFRVLAFKFCSAAQKYRKLLLECTI